MGTVLPGEILHLHLKDQLLVAELTLRLRVVCTCVCVCVCVCARACAYVCVLGLTSLFSLISAFLAL